jgi:hypothetical protein
MMKDEDSDQTAAKPAQSSWFSRKFDETLGKQVWFQAISSVPFLAQTVAALCGLTFVVLAGVSIRRFSRPSVAATPRAFSLLQTEEKTPRETIMLE